MDLSTPMDFAKCLATKDCGTPSWSTTASGTMKDGTEVTIVYWSDNKDPEILERCLIVY